MTSEKHIFNKALIYKKIIITVFVIIFDLVCQARSIDIATLNFQKIDPNMVPNQLEMLSSVVKANFDKIKTWEGMISFESMYIYRDEKAAEILKEHAGVDPVEATKEIGQFAVGTIQFKLDLKKNLLFRHINRPVPLEYIEFGRNITHLSLSGTLEGTRINSSDYEIKCYPNQWRQGVISRRIAEKRLSRQGNQWLLGDTDPRSCFYLGTPVWVLLPQFSGYLRLYHQGSIVDSIAIDVVLEVAHIPEGVIYRGQITTPGAEQLVSTFILDGTKGLNPIYTQLKNGKGVIVSEVTTDFTKVDDVFLPTKQYSLHYDNDGLLRREKRWTFSDMQVNMIIPDATFSINNLGLQDGDIYVDEIKNKRYHYKTGGELVEMGTGEQ